VDKGGNLLFRSVSPHDAVGIYICVAENDIGMDQKMFLISKSKTKPSQKTKRSLFDQLTQFETRNSRNASFHILSNRVTPLEENRKRVIYGLDSSSYPYLQQRSSYELSDKFLSIQLPIGLISPNRQTGRCTQNISCSKLAGKFALSKSKLWPSSSQAQNGFNNDEQYPIIPSKKLASSSRAALCVFASNLTVTIFYIIFELLKSIIYNKLLF